MPAFFPSALRRLRFAFLVLFFCVAVGSLLAEARFHVITAGELSFFGSWLRPGPEFAARKPLVAVLIVLLCAVVGPIHWLLSRRFSSAAVIALEVAASVGLAAQQTYAVRAERVQRMAFVRMMHQLERSAAPGEAVIVESPQLLMQLRWYAGNGFRQQLTGEFDARKRPQNDEAILVGRADGSAGREVKSAGLALREDEASTDAADILGRFAGEGTRIWFVTASR